MRLIGCGNKKERSYYVFEKSEDFFSFFPSFLIGCGFDNLGEYEDYQENVPNIKTFENKVEHFRNEGYDLDVIFTSNRIVLIIRTCEENQKLIASNFLKFSN